MKERIVIKVGTSTLLGNHEQPRATFEYVAESINVLSTKYDIVLVTSGAIGFGVTTLSLEGRPTETAKLQALASLGQVGLMERWNQAMGKKPVGQVLLTARELEQLDNLGALQATFQSMWQLNILPIVNENDAITNDEITFGDNDKLAALVAHACKATKLILLTDQDGIQRNFGTTTQERIDVLSIKDVAQHVRDGGSEHSRGGIASKVIAAQIALDYGIETYIAYAATAGSAEAALAGKTGTKLIQ